MKILLVDDEKFLRDMMSQFLVKQGHSVVKAENGKEGWEIFNQSPEEFHAIISDLKMPVMDGLEMLKLIREKGYNLPAVVITGHLEMVGTHTMTELNILELFSKPFMLTELGTVLSKLEQT